MTTILPVNYEPRWYQLPLLDALDSGIKRAAVVWPRRHGKDKSVLNWCIKTIADPSFSGVIKTPCTCFYCLPEISQGRKVIWNSIDHSGFPFKSHFPLALIENLNNQEMRVTFKNGSIFQIVGSDCYDSLIGTNPKIIVFSEYAKTNPKAWEILGPIVDDPDNDGIAIFISTPRGKNHFHKLFVNGKKNPQKWFTELITNDDTQLMTPKRLQELRDEGRSEEFIQQEYFCSFEGLIEGSIYGRYVLEADRTGKICSIPYLRTHLVHTAWDIGLDATSVVFFQLVDNSINVIDHYESKNLAAEGSIGEVLKRPYIFGTHFSPHDGRNRSVLTGSNFVQLAEQLGMDMTVIPNTKSKHDGIDIVKGLFPRMQFDNVKCEYLVSCIQSYHLEYDEKLDKYKAEPAHDWTSHASDAMRYMAIAIKEGYISGEHKSEWSNIKKNINYYDNMPNNNHPGFLR